MNYILERSPAPQPLQHETKDAKGALKVPQIGRGFAN